MDIKWRSSGGVCDGNTLAAAGLPNVDSLGPVGDGMHTPREYVLVDSIGERARLVALFLMKLASKEIPWSQFQNAPFRPISALGENFNPRNTHSMPVVEISAPP